jgi:hypothetical protein
MGLLAAWRKRFERKYIERLRNIPDNSHEPVKSYTNRYKIFLVASGYFLMVLSFVVVFVTPADVRWVLPWIVGPLVAAWLVLAYTCRCAKCSELVLVSYRLAPFKRQPHEVAILFSRRFQCRTCGQRYSV